MNNYSIWGSEHESFSNFTKSMKESVIRDTTEADIQSEMELLK